MAHPNIEKDSKEASSEKDGLPLEFKNFGVPFGLEDHVFNIIFFGIIPHTCALYYLLYLWPFEIITRSTLLCVAITGYTTGLGITVGAHRLWAHKTFQANLPLRIILMLLQTAASQYPIFKWCWQHRVHHKYTDTNGDPYSSSRGFWFSHITWLFQRRHPDVEEMRKTIDISDLARDPVVVFQSEYYWKLWMIVFLIIPMGILAWLYPTMSFFHIFVTNYTRYAISCHFTFLVNSVAHIWGNKPYDKHISPAENKLVSLLAMGEGWHNFHHTFPWDFKAAEFGFKLNASTFVIHFFSLIGWAWDLKTVSTKLLVDRINRTGDGSHRFHENNEVSTKEDVDSYPSLESKKVLVWGWGDEDICKEDLLITKTLFPMK